MYLAVLGRGGEDVASGLRSNKEQPTKENKSKSIANIGISISLMLHLSGMYLAGVLMLAKSNPSKPIHTQWTHLNTHCSHFAYYILHSSDGLSERIG